MILGMEQTDTPHAGHGQANIPKEKKLVSGLDGQSRSARHEDDLNKLLMRVFRGPDGEAALKYLRSITINYINGPGVNADVLKHMEGQRFIVSMVEKRIEQGSSK